MTPQRDAGFWLLFSATLTTLLLLIASTIVVLAKTSETLPGWNHLALLAIFAGLLALMVWAMLKARISE